jgi:gentisate 1,2-dioxygenase
LSVSADVDSLEVWKMKTKQRTFLKKKNWFGKSRKRKRRAHPLAIPVSVEQINSSSCIHNFHFQNVLGHLFGTTALNTRKHSSDITVSEVQFTSPGKGGTTEATFHATLNEVAFEQENGGGSYSAPWCPKDLGFEDDYKGP